MFSEVLTAFEQQPLFYHLTILILGLMVGSFLNVVIYRFPLMMQREWHCECRELLSEEIDKSKIAPDELPENFSLAVPASACPKCRHKIKIWENIPVISWLLLKGKCASCKANISIRYPSIELLTGLLSLAIAIMYGPTIQAAGLLLLTWTLVALTFIDLDHMLLPDQMTLPLVWIGLLLNTQAVFVPLTDAVIGAVAGYMSLYIVFWLFKLLTGKEGMGYGDFKLFAVFGAWIGWQLLPMLILMASLVGAIVGISMVVFKNHGRENPIPFGPYIAAAGLLTILWGNEIWQWYLGLLS